MADLAADAGMFWSAFLAALVLPGTSENLLVAMLVSGMGEPRIVVEAATVGNTLGSVANCARGRFLAGYRERGWFPVTAALTAERQANLPYPINRDKRYGLA